MSDVSRQRALLARGIAENHIRSLNYTGARRQILRAMEIFPALNNATEMLSVCDVLCASSIDLPTCGINWYWVMQLSPTVDGPTIQGQYQNLTSLLGRIKGSFPGTETALEFVHEAYSVLSDPIMRSAFDLKRNGGAEGSDASESQVECVDGNETVAADAVDERRIPMDVASESPCSSGFKKYVVKGTNNEGCKSQYFLETHPADKEKHDICNEASCSASQAEHEADMSIDTCLGSSKEPYSSSAELVRTSRPFSGYYEFGKDRKIEKFSVGQVRVAFDMEKHVDRVDGYRNIFQQNKGGGKESSFHIPAEKLFLFSHGAPLFRFKGGEVDGKASGVLELDPSGMPNHLNQDFSFPFITYRESAPSAEAKIDCPSIPPAVTTSSTSLKTGLQNYKTKWSFKDFKKDEIWAVYTGPDAMPRLYVKIVNVISENFVNVSFLEPRPILDGETQWVKEGMPFVCGIFKEGNLISTMDVNKFSHPVKHDCGTAKPFYKIFPQKGEVWATYRKRNVASWKDGYPRKHEYRIVEIVSDSCDKSGVDICSLIEVKGYMTIFQRQLHDNFQLMRHISRQEMLSFSHRIPAFTMVGVNNSDIPKESWHLQPDSLPPNSN